jgi:hypothetical protein
MNTIEKTLEERTAAAEALLSAAVRVEIAAFVSKHVEDRLRARPHFLGRMPHIALQQMRAEVDRLVRQLAERAEQPVRDLRIFLGSSPRSETEEAQALMNGLAFVVDAARELLTTWAFPGDNRPDRAEDSGVDLDAEYHVHLTLSPNLVWAWRSIRALDTARNQLADAAGRPVPETFEIRLWAPEALPDDPT